MSATVFIALGGNLGDRHGTLTAALAELEREGFAIRRVSTLRETAPVGGPPEQGHFLNGVVCAETDHAPMAALERLRAVEAKLGRVRDVKNGPRPIDLDLLFHEDAILSERRLIVPHPRLQDRLFVLEPLAEIAPEWRHPVFGKRCDELLERCHARMARRAEATPGRESAGLRVMVTGSTSGIGRAIALELAKAGADVIVHGRSSRDRAEEVAALCRESGGVAETMMADLGDPANVHALVDQAWRHWHGLDAWVHCAGADTLTGPEARRPFEEKLETLWNVDVRGTMLAARRIGAWMKNRGEGVILTIGWDQSETGMEGDSGELFAATKGAITAFSKSLSLSLAPLVRVNILAPGWIRTAWGEQASPAWQARVHRETPLGRWGLPEDVAAAARWLLSPSASFVTGQTIRVNGGTVR